jgi:hypothetical protein
MRRIVVGLALVIASSLDAQSRPKDPGVATLWSVFVTGAGQMYSGETGKGVGMLLGQMAATGAAFVLWDRERDEIHTYPFPPGSPIPTYTDTTTVSARGPAYAALGIGGALWAYSLIDAAPAARRFNRRHSLTVAPGPRGTVRIGFALR